MIGKTISHYKIIEKLGEGGMGVVYKAEDTKLKREVAIKFLPRFISINKAERKRFEIEAQAAALLNHPNISTIYAIEETEDEMFIVMEFIDGKELKDKINSGPISTDEAIKIAIQLAEGLEAAHKKGIVHRDIKSSNIMITKDCKVKIMDFGLAKIKGGTELTKIGSTVGTVAYMSPEQAKGEVADNKTDIWSFGVVLYEMLTGELPFKADYDQAIIYSILNEEPEPNNNFNSLIPNKFKQIVMRCLVKSKDTRYESCSKLLSDLKSINKQRVVKPKTDYEIKYTKPYFVFEEGIFVGREVQLEFLLKKFKNIRKTKESTVFIYGESGIGKSQLVTKALRQISKSSINFIWGRCVFQEGGLPYHPFVSGIKNSVHNVNDEFINVLLNQSVKCGINLSTRIPYIKSFLNLSNESVSLLHKEQLWDSVLLLLQVFAAEQPLIFILDDLQWADKTSLDLFSYIARNITKLPILLIGMYRRDAALSDEIVDDASLTETVRQLNIEGVAHQINLTELSEEESAKFVSGLLVGKKVDRRLSEKIFKHTEGLPLFISELVNLLKEKQLVFFENRVWKLREDQQFVFISSKIQDIIYQRLNRLDDDLKEILEIASCEGEYFLSETLAACLNVKRITLLKQLQILESKYNLVKHVKNLYRFDHLMIQQVMYESILPELREEYHRMIASYLVDKYSMKDEYAARIAHHLISSRQEEGSLDYLLRAANLARDLYANEDALNLYLKINKIVKQFGTNNSSLLMAVEEGLGDVNNSIGNSEDALSNFTNYLNLAQQLSSQVDEIRALRKKAEVNRTIGKVDVASEICDEAILKAKAINNKEELINCISTMAFIYAAKGEYDRTIKISEEALSLTQEINDSRNQSISLSNLGFAYWHIGNYPSAMKYFNEAITIQRSIGDSLGLSTTLNFLGLANWKLGEYERALDNASESVKIKKSIADYRKIPGSLNVIGDIYRSLNDLEKAIEFHSESLALATEHQNKGAMCDNIRDLGEDYMLMREFESAKSKLDEVLKLSKTSGIMWYETRTYITLSELYLIMGNELRAELFADKGLEYANKLNAKDLIIEAMWTQARVLAMNEPSDESTRLFKLAIELAEDVGHKTFLWKLYFDFSMLLEIQQRSEETDDALQKSKRILQGIVDNFKNPELKKSFVNSQSVKQVLTNSD